MPNSLSFFYDRLLPGIAVLLCVWLMAFAACAQPQPPALHQISVQSGQGIDRVVLHLTQALEYRSFRLENPPRLVVDMPMLELRAQQGVPQGYTGNVLANIRLGRFNPETTRMVFDLAHPQAKLDEVTIRNTGGEVAFAMIFDVITPDYVAGSKNNMADWQRQASTPAEIRNSAAPTGGSRSTSDWAELAERASRPAPMPAHLPFTTVPVPEFKPRPARKPVIVLDAGHGGRDPGALGVKGTREKEVTLHYTRHLRDALLRTGRYDVVLTRTDDTYIMLRERLEIGRRAKADIFISVHADSAENPKARGFSIYTLSEVASDKEAAALATRENKVDIIYGMNLSTEQPDVTEILIDLAQRETKNKSMKLADTLVTSVGKRITLLPNTHRQAGFAVLKAPDVPSVLVEIGFLSNRRDEALITSSNYRTELVAAMVQGIDSYFAQQKNR